MEEIDLVGMIPKELPKGKMVVVVMLLFLIGGFMIGYSIGNYVMYNKWKYFHLSYEEFVNDSCYCIKKDTIREDLRWEYG